MPPLFLSGQAQNGLVLVQPRKLHAFIPELFLLVLIPCFLTAQKSKSAKFFFNLIQDDQTCLRSKRNIVILQYILKLWSQTGNHHFEMYEPRVCYRTAI